LTFETKALKRYLILKFEFSNYFVRQCYLANFWGIQPVEMCLGLANENKNVHLCAPDLPTTWGCPLAAIKP